MRARLRGAPAGLPFGLDAQTLANGDSFTFTTDVGSLDILATPSGTSGYDDLARTSENVSAFGVEIDGRTSGPQPRPERVIDERDRA